MNVNEISYMYNSALNGLSVEGTNSVNYEKQIDAAKEALKKAEAGGFSSSLSEEVSKLERQLDELKGKTDREKTATLRSQLQSDIDELKKLESEEASIKEQ